MGNVISKEGVLPEIVVSNLFSKVSGKSSLARLSASRAIPFVGSKEFVFDLDNEVDLVAENGAKSNGGGTVKAVTVVPYKFEYGMRVSDEFERGSTEYKLDVTERFIEGFAKKMAKGVDIAGIHGYNPRTGAPSDVVKDNNFDAQIPAENVVPYDATTPDANLESAIALVDEMNGMALAPAFAKAMGDVKANGMPLYPEFKFGRNPEEFAGHRSDVNKTVAVGDIDMAIVGDFENAFRWGYAKDIELEIIRYGNPDNNADLGDLRGRNQVYLRCEAYVGWAILAPERFARIGESVESE